MRTKITKATLLMKNMIGQTKRALSLFFIFLGSKALNIVPYLAMKPSLDHLEGSVQSRMIKMTGLNIISTMKMLIQQQ